jgi:hypothetical protein
MPQVVIGAPRQKKVRVTAPSELVAEMAAEETPTPGDKEWKRTIDPW